MYKLKCAIQNYDWGRKASESLVASIFSANGGSVDESKKYAEYWMGTHINGPSQIELTNNSTINLSDLIKEKFGLIDGLPFLFKVLSIKDPLSIQVHPDKQMAECLFKEEPNHYKDPNHKPEMAIVLSESFEMFYGLLDINSANELIASIFNIFKVSKSEEFIKLCEIFHSEKTEDSYKNFLKGLILLKDEDSKTVISSLNESFEEVWQKNSKNDFIVTKLNLFKILNNIFEEDRGLLFSLFMNYLKLKQGEYIFINANIPHAYIKGDCTECMANSDNVIRLGLTPKFVDANNFLKIIEKEFKSMTDNSINDDIIPVITENLVTYTNPKYDDFKVMKLSLEKSQVSQIKIPNFSIIFVYKGNCLIKDMTNIQEFKLNQFDTYFIEKSLELEVHNIKEDRLTLFIATY